VQERPQDRQQHGDQGKRKKKQSRHDHKGRHFGYPAETLVVQLTHATAMLELR
jgi:hypothetical protein